jgi:hypothetical protein
MDASDILRKAQSKTTYSFYKNKLAVTQPNVDIATCATPSNIRVSYPTYAERDILALGKFITNACSNTTQVPIVNTGNTHFRIDQARYDHPTL